MTSLSLNKHFRVFVDRVLIPEISALEAETEQPIDVTVHEYSGNVQGSTVTISSTRTGRVPAVAEVRVAFVATFREGTSRFVAQAVVRNLKPGTGFSGFQLRGRLIQDDQNSQITCEACTYTYNTWDWGKPFVTP